MSCCRSPKQAPAARSTESHFCSKCNENLHDLFLASATHQTRGHQGSSTVLPKVTCPRCNTVNVARVNVVRKVKR